MQRRASDRRARANRGHLPLRRNGSESVGPLSRAIEDAHLCHAAFEQGERDAARRTAGTEHAHRRAGELQRGLGRDKLSMNPALSVLSATSLPPSNQSVLAAPAARAAGRVSDAAA